MIEMFSNFDTFQHTSTLFTFGYICFPWFKWRFLPIQPPVLLFTTDAMYRPPNETAKDHSLILETAENILQQLSTYDKADYKLLTLVTSYHI